MKEIKTYPLEDRFIKLEGKFWVGDPCYIFADNSWQKLCKLMCPTHTDPDFDDRDTVRVVEVDGVKCYLFGTAYGDGTYNLKQSDEVIGKLGVDAGMLSIIPMEIVKLRGWGKTKWAGTEITFRGNNKKQIGVDGGDFFVDIYSIRTTDEEETYEDYDDEEEEDDDEPRSDSYAGHDDVDESWT